jgi:hypothetical protein
MAVAAVQLLSGCVNQFASTYVPDPGSPLLGSAPAAAKKTVKVAKSSNLHADILRLTARGYAVLGRSGFNMIDTTQTSADDLVKQAKAVGADVVLLKTRDLGSTEFTRLDYVGRDDLGLPDFRNDEVSFETYMFVAVYLRLLKPAAPNSAKSRSG